MPPRERPVPMRPGTPIPCRKGDALLGRQVPGRNAGVVTTCATPDRKHPTEGRVGYGFPGIGPTMRRSTARNRLRAEQLGGVVADDAAGVAQIARMLLGDREPLAMPTGVEFPHRRGTSPCDAEHPRWANYEADLEEARERGALDVGDEADAAEFERATARALDQAHPDYRALATSCAKAFERRELDRQGKAIESTTRERSRARAAFVARGGDVGSAEYWDDVIGALAGKRRGNRP